MSEPHTSVVSTAGTSAGNASRRPDVRASIARAAQATGIDFNYLLAQAKLESSLDPAARASGSSAAGLYQFTSGTWLQTLDRHGARHGMGWADAAISGGRVADPAMRAQVMALRYDADASALMAAELASDNRAELTATLGREPDASELYLAHFLGIGGARQFLSALAADPGQSAAAVLPQAAGANRRIFYEPGGAARSVGAVMDLLRGRVNAAMDGGTPFIPAETDLSWPDGNFAPAPAIAAGGPVQRQFLAARQDAAATMPARASMADTLRSAFALGGGERGAAPAFVHNAYGQLRKFGL